MRWPLYLIADLAMLVIAYCLAPVLPLFVIGKPVLPRWLSWFETPDNPLDGDNGWRYEHWQWRYKLPSWLAIYIGRVGWLWRNPAYGFDIQVLGYPSTLQTRVTVTGNEMRYVKRARDPKTGNAWQVFVLRRYSTHRAIRINLGWKLWSIEPNASVRCQFVCSVNPYKYV